MNMAIPRRSSRIPKEKLHKALDEIAPRIHIQELTLGGDNETAIGHTAEEVLFDAIITVLFVSHLDSIVNLTICIVFTNGCKLFPLELQMHASKVEKENA